MSRPLPHLENAEETLDRHFGLSGFRPGQAEVVSTVLSGRNVVVVMPTGAGKSLCYQLPAVMLPGVTLVVSPLIALMKDQVEQLSERGIPATFINSTLSDLERADRQRRIRAGEFKLVYVAPERFRSGAFLEAISQLELSLFAVDEAHCISQWGHDFRPDYSLLGKVRKYLRPPRTVALTATATQEVRDDIVRVLLMKDPQVFVAGFDRKNLFLEVNPVSGDDDKRAACAELAASSGGSGIVYCATRKAAEGLHHALKGHGVKSVLYHAGMTDEARHKAQDTFMGAARAVAVATNAFGMGIDKPDIRFVAHAAIPRAVEAYYQEIGRAGRDGKQARAVLLFNHADVFTQERLIESSYPPDTLFADLWKFLLGKARGTEDGEVALSLETLASRIDASEPEVTAVLKLLERAGLIARTGTGRSEPSGARGRGKWKYSFADRPIRLLAREPFESLKLDLTGFRTQHRQALKLLKQMTQYAYAQDCRRSFLLRYFGDLSGAGACSGCDICSGATLSPHPPRAVPKPKRRPRSGGRTTTRAH